MSYFSSKAARERKVGIAKWPPRFWTGERANMLAPSNPKAENWQEEYLKDLEGRFPKGEGLLLYLQEIEKITPNAILCCFESDPSECHRSILAKYALEHLGVIIEEWKSNKPVQGNLLS